MREEFCFVRSYVDTNGTISLASFAGKTQIKSLLHGFRTPAVLDHIPRHHFPEKSGTAPRGMLLLHRNAITRAHGALFHATTFTNTNTTLHCPVEAAIIIGKLKR